MNSEKFENKYFFLYNNAKKIVGVHVPYKYTCELNVTLKTYKMSSRKGQVIKVKTFSIHGIKILQQNVL